MASTPPRCIALGNSALGNSALSMREYNVIRTIPNAPADSDQALPEPPPTRPFSSELSAGARGAGRAQPSQDVAKRRCGMIDLLHGGEAANAEAQGAEGKRILDTQRA